MAFAPSDTLGGALLAIQRSEVTQLLHDWQAGNELAGDKLITLIYPDLPPLSP